MTSGAHTVTAIVNFNGAERTLSTLRSLLQAPASARVTSIVVDNGSQQADSDKLREVLPEGTTLVALDVNVGYAGAANIAADWARKRGAAFLWLLNNDLELLPNALSLLREALESDPLAAAAAPITVSAGPAGRVLSAGADVNLWLGKVTHRLAHRPLHTLPEDPYDVAAVEGSALLIRMSAMDRIGPLDERFFMYWEDTEWSLRARRAGYRLLVVPTAVVIHEEGASSSPAERMAAILVNRVRFVKRCASPAQRIVFYAYFFGAWLPAYAVARLLPRYGPAHAARTIARALAAAYSDDRDPRQRP
jgi:GT2 family glycosyltransferase